MQTLRDNAVLNGDVSDFRTGYGEGFVAAPGSGYVVEDHVASFCDRDSVFSAASAFSHANADVAHDGIIGIAEAPAVAVDCDTITGRGLAEDAHAFGYDHAVRDGDEATHGEYDYAVRLRNGIAEGARARIIEVRNNVNGTVPATDGVATEAFSAREGESRGRGGQERNESEKMHSGTMRWSRGF